MPLFHCCGDIGLNVTAEFVSLQPIVLTRFTAFAFMAACFKYP